jgi:hypothetical protein
LLEAIGALPIFTSHKFAQDFKLWNCSSPVQHAILHGLLHSFVLVHLGLKGIVSFSKEPNDSKYKLNFIKELSLLL